MFAFKVIVRPIRNFYDLKHEKEGNLGAALTIVGLVIMTFIFKRQLTRFVFQNPFLDPKDLNIISEALGIIVPFILWCVSNWCLTTLMDGDGSFRDIVIASGYALFPLVIINIPMILLSWVLTIDEGGFYFILDSTATAWTLLLIFISTMVTHQYTLKKTIFTTVLIIIGMGLIAFIALLFVTLIQQMYGFVYSIYKELIFRL